MEKSAPIQIHELNVDLVESIIELGNQYGISPFILEIENGKDVFSYSDPQSNFEQSFLNDRKNDPRLIYSKHLKPLEHTLTINFLGKTPQIQKLTNG